MDEKSVEEWPNDSHHSPKKNTKIRLNKQLNDLTEQMIDAKIEEAENSLKKLRASNLDLFKLQGVEKHLRQEVSDLTTALNTSETTLAKTQKNLDRTTELKANQKERLENIIVDLKIKRKK